MKNIKYFVVLLLVAVTLTLLLFASGRLFPSRVVNYYGEILTDEELDLRTHRTYCGFIPLNPFESLVQSYSYKPIAMCFDTTAELDAWHVATGRIPPSTN
jgi:hypothetical protein